ncbi:hypothetical protein WJX77_009381 [Trebouxia sp. C0004]
MQRVRSVSVHNCALALRCLSFATSTRGSNVTSELKNVQLALEEALEGVNYIRQSAHQAFLETEPGFRSITEEYMMRYQTFARDELVKALDKHQALLNSVGEDAFSEMSHQQKDFKLTFAESLLAKEKLDAALRRNAAKIADREALTPRPEHQAGFINQDPCKPAWELPM